MSNSPHPHVYLDYAATTPVDPEVASAMAAWIEGPESFGNPSSIHAFGRKARAAIDNARDSVASLIAADYSEITFTGSGTEADNLALTGVMKASAGRDHLVTSSIEHHAILHCAKGLEAAGFRVTVVPVDGDGVVSLEALSNAITDRTALVSIMHANNEIGTVQPVGAIATLAHDRGALFHTDAVQTTGLIRIDVNEIGCDLLSMSAHKIYGPKGVGALYVRSGVKVAPILYGGAQERERRPGTENVPGIVGMGVAASLASARRDLEMNRLTILRDTFIRDLTSRITGVSLNGSATSRLGNNVNISIDGIDGSTLLMNLDRAGIYASSGSACSSGSIEPSHVLSAIGLASSSAAGGIRFSLGRHTTLEDVSIAVAAVEAIASRLRCTSGH